MRVDPDDNAWLSGWAANAIVRFDPTTEKFESFPSNRFSQVLPTLICADIAPAQQVWEELRGGATMGLNWKSVKAVHVNQACEALLNSAGPKPKPGGLIVIYKDKQLPAKAILERAYCLANNIPPETKLKFASSESSLQLLRSLGFRAERLQTSHLVAAKD